MDQKKTQKSKKQQRKSSVQEKQSKPAHPGKTVTRVTHVPMQSVKMIKMGGAVLGSTVFSSLDYSVNAGNSDLWPRLAQVAKTYQYWRAVNWHVRYEPIASVFGSNKSGIITVSLLENWYDAPPDTMTAQTERARRSITVPAWECATLKLDPTRWKYVRDSYGSQGQDMRLDDEVIEVGVEGTDASSVGAAIGYLYLTADIEFRTPYTVSMLNPPRTNTIYIANRKTDFSCPSGPSGVTTSIAVEPASDGFLTNSAYSGVFVSGGNLYLSGGTYNVRTYCNFQCAAAGSSLQMFYIGTAYKQLIQLDAAAASVGAYLPLPSAGVAEFCVSECVITVAEGGTATLSPTVTCFQSGSTPIASWGMLIVITAH
jgi:hypothetical protein